MNRIDKKFRELREKNKKAFIAFIMAGDPSLGVTKKLIFELSSKGADIIELGVPFSDPMADGPTIQKSSERGLKSKTTLASVFNLVRNARLQIQTPIVFLIYYNLVFHYGLEKFINTAVDSGVDGVVIPDLPPEESIELCKIAKKNRFSIIHLLAPTSSIDRIKKVAKASSGFIYYVSLTGTTGARKKLAEDIGAKLRAIKNITKIPVCVGFGISTPGQVKEIQKVSDGAIVGSAIIKIIENNIGKKDLVKKVGNFVKTLKGGG
ncbi:MAG: tryptophan synthase subunit alpha [Omnitrophica bacterium GWA2_41_15]|nr:MAG: tryptophan synthase subunit alpha [Omnitrophica bacterium GWA2_41_15]HAZ11117.1 tryptophan synthase subunit alpha [Candidatus Omnitrophota bacterium]